MVSVPTETWLQTDEIQEFIQALEFSASVSAVVNVNSANWKWLLIAMHNALQGAFVCSLRGNDTIGLSVLDVKSAGEVFAWVKSYPQQDSRPSPPKEKLAPFMDLYRRVSDQNYLPNPLRRNADQDADVKRLNDLRNEYIHFVPKGFSLELSGLPRIIENACGIIHHLAIAHPTFDHHFDGDERDRILRALQRLMAK